MKLRQCWFSKAKQFWHIFNSYEYSWCLQYCCTKDLNSNRHHSNASQLLLVYVHAPLDPVSSCNLLLSFCVQTQTTVLKSNSAGSLCWFVFPSGLLCSRLCCACLIPSRWHVPTVGDGWASQRPLSLALVSSHSARLCSQLQEVCGLHWSQRIWKMCGSKKLIVLTSVMSSTVRSISFHPYEK